MIVSSVLAAFVISPASSGEASGEVETNLDPTIEYITDDGSTYRTYMGYSNTTKHRYTWIGDTIELKVKVTDGNGLEDIESVELYISDLKRTCPVKKENLTETSAYYTLTYTVPAKVDLYGDKAIKVKVTDTDGSFDDTSTEIDMVWFNPIVRFCTSGSVSYEQGDPGEIVQASESVDSSSDCGSKINGSIRDFVIDGKNHYDDETSNYEWAMRVKNTANGNVFLELNISSTDMTGDKGVTIPVTNQYFFMNSTSNSVNEGTLTIAAKKVDELIPDEYNYFDFYLKYPAVPKDTYRGAINFAVTAI